ncbi:hypothetical protein D3C78_754050 [compost metagenome]
MAAQAVAVRTVVAPQRLLERLAAQHMRAFLHQQGQQLEPQRIELETPTGAADLQGVQVVTEIAHLQQAPPAALAAPQHRLDARGQLAEGERLDQIVVGAGLEALQAVVELVAGGEHDHRNVAARFVAQAPAEAVAVQAWQHHVEHQQVVVPGGGQVQAGQAVLRTVDAVTLERQVVGQIGQDVAIVFDQQNAHEKYLLPQDRPAGLGKS